MYIRAGKHFNLKNFPVFVLFGCFIIRVFLVTTVHLDEQEIR